MAEVGLLIEGQPVVLPAPLELPPAGLKLVLRVSPGATLTSATLRLSAQPPTVNDVAPAHISSDLGRFCVKAENNTKSPPIRFLNATFENEIAICSLKLTVAGADAGMNAGADGWARIRTFSNGAWTPLAPIDTVALGREQVFPPVAAQQIMAEFLAASGPSVLLPTALRVTAIELKSTSQPCYVSLSIADGPAFFTRPGPLPASPVTVEGLARLVSGWLSEHPGTTDVPIIIRAANGGSLLVTEFSPEWRGPTTPPPPPAPPRPAKSSRALLCDEGHAAAQNIGATPSGNLLRAVALWVRAGTACVAGQVTLQPDPRDRPADASPAVTLDFSLDADTQPKWLMLALAKPLALSGTSWVVCRVSTGELLWYRARADAGGIPPLISVGGGAWQPAPADPDEPAPAALLVDPSWTAA
jgi:hypothetical protein